MVVGIANRWPRIIADANRRPEMIMKDRVPPRVVREQKKIQT